MAIITVHEGHRITHSLGHILLYSVIAVICWILETCLPQRLVGALTGLDIALQTWGFLPLVMKGSPVPTAVVIIVFALWSLWVVMMFRVIPTTAKLTMQVGVVMYGYRVTASLVAWYLHRDEPAYEYRARIIGHRDGLMAFFTTACSLRVPGIWGAIGQFLTSPVTLAPGFLLTMLLVMYPDLTNVVFLGALRLSNPTLTKCAAIWDILDGFEAWWFQFQKDLEVRTNDLDWKTLHGDLDSCQYEYKPLRPGDIRILKLYKQSPRSVGLWKARGAIKASIEHVQLQHAGIYEAVSYCWGENAGTTSIVLDDGLPYQTTLRIPKSAYEVLRSRRSDLTTRRVWIDAICINQQDLLEKSTQIQLMRDIYRGAKRVIAFPCSQPSVRLVVPLLYQAAENLPVYQQQDSLLEFRPMSASVKLAPRYKALQRLLNSEYFRRAWVIQELAVGGEVHFYLGGLFVPLGTLCRGVEHFASLSRVSYLLEGISMDNMVLPHIKENLRLIIQLRLDTTDQWSYNVSYEDRTKLSLILMTTVQFRASDPRDTIFAKLGIANDLTATMPALLRPDYSKSAIRVLRDAARYLFIYSAHPSLDALCYAGIGFFSSRRRLPGLPSWVPSFSLDTVHPRLTSSLPPQRRTRFDSFCGTFRASSDFQCRASECMSSAELLLRGVVCDKILAVSAGMPRNMELGGERPPGLVNDLHGALWTNATLREEARGLTRLIASHRHLWAGCDDNILDEMIGRVLITDPEVRTKHAGDPDFTALFRAWLAICEASPMDQRGRDVYARVAVQFRLNMNEFARYQLAVGFAMAGRRFAITECGRMCLVPPLSEAGDDVFIPFGAQAPYLCRSTGIPGSYQLVGEAFVQEVMMGEAMCTLDSQPDSVADIYLR